MSKEIVGTSPSGTLYARIRKTSNGYWWNGSSFETYTAANYSTYAVSMSEEGNSQVYVADFPTGITSAGTYEIYVHRGTPPTEGDYVVSIGRIDWSGSAAISSVTAAMSGSEFYDYVLRCGFKRTDKATEVYEAITDAIQELRRRFMFDEAENEITTTDTISTLGDFKIDLESDFGLLLGVVLEDDDTGTTLTRIPKSQFDKFYPGINVDSNNGYPKHFCVYAGQIYVGPSPDSTSYSYRISYSKRAGTITSSTTGVPFTNVYRDILKDCTLAHLYKGLEDYDKSSVHRNDVETQMIYATRRERINSGVHCFNVKPFGC